MNEETQFNINDQVIIIKIDDPMYAFMGYIVKVPKGLSKTYHVTFKMSTSLHFFVHRVYYKEHFKLIMPRKETK